MQVPGLKKIKTVTENILALSGVPHVNNLELRSIFPCWGRMTSSLLQISLLYVALCLPHTFNPMVHLSSSSSAFLTPKDFPRKSCSTFISLVRDADCSKSQAHAFILHCLPLCAFWGPIVLGCSSRWCWPLPCNPSSLGRGEVTASLGGSLSFSFSCGRAKVWAKTPMAEKKVAAESVPDGWADQIRKEQQPAGS